MSLQLVTSRFGSPCFVNHCLIGGIASSGFWAQNPEEAIPPIKQWLTKHGLPNLEVTNCKDMDMIELWDDRCVQVVPNTGNPIGPNPEPYRRT